MEGGLASTRRTLPAPDMTMIIGKVLSPSTEASDRGEKFATYRLISSLREYVLIDPERLTVEAYRRTGEGVWTLRACRMVSRCTWTA